MPTLRCTLASTATEISDAQRVRWLVYGVEERMLPESAGTGGLEIDAHDDRAETLHLVAYVAGQPVGTVRLLLSDTVASQRASGRLGLDLESKVDLGMLSGSAISIAEVTRYCVLRRYRCTRVTHALFSRLREESGRRGITHWVAGANMETDFAEDAALAYRVAGDLSLLSPRFRAEIHASRPPRTRQTRHCYTDEQRRRARGGQRAGLDLPRTLSLFARRMGARFIGPPVYDRYFNVFALPLVTALADLAVP
ncbi:MAG TPA: GNAT family N-acyltransferase [Polyangia bacterium]|nr:GNAT family N-acyltransferase [Polyangia bacterium]